MAFVIWWAGKVLGIENAAQFAEAIGKGPPQISKWISEKPRPGWDSIKQIADAVGISAVWLDQPTREGSIEPTEFSGWLAARRTWQAKQLDKNPRRRALGKAAQAPRKKASGDR